MIFSQIDPRGVCSILNTVHLLSHLDVILRDMKTSTVEPRQNCSFSLQHGCVRRSEIINVQPLPEARRKIHETCQVLTYYSPEKRRSCKVCHDNFQLNFNEFWFPFLREMFAGSLPSPFEFPVLRQTQLLAQTMKVVAVQGTRLMEKQFMVAWSTKHCS